MRNSINLDIGRGGYFSKELRLKEWMLYWLHLWTPMYVAVFQVLDQQPKLILDACTCMLNIPRGKWRRRGCEVAISPGDDF